MKAARSLRARLVINPMFRWFERRVTPYPEGPPKAPPGGFFAFMWACSAGLRPYIIGMTLCTAVIGAFEALLFAMLGRIVDWLAAVEPSQLWSEHRGTLLLLAGVLAASPLLVALQTILKHQALAANFPMRLRWNFHRLMLGQSMSFYQDEFAGRVATKVMQTALAVRDTWFTVADILVFTTIYFVTMVSVVGYFDFALLVPFLAWVALYGVCVAWFVPRLARIGAAQADARSLMTGRVTDAYTNIATVKLYTNASHNRIRVEDQSSYLGVRGTEDLGGGLKAFYQLETSFRPDSNNSTFANRNSGIGLQSGWGSVMAGRWDMPFKSATIAIDPYGDLTIGGITGAANDRGNFDIRQQNVIQYWSPNWSGFAVKLAYGVNEGRTATANPEAYGASLVYSEGPLYLAYAYEQHKNGNGGLTTVTPGYEEEGNAQVGSIKVGPDKLGGLYQTFDKTDRTKQDTYMVNAVWTTGKHDFSIQ